MKYVLRLLATLFWVATANSSFAQEPPLSFATIDRPPFAFLDNREATGFSIELTKAIADQLGREVSFEFYDSFSGMLTSVQDGNHDAAVANISITADRELLMDFSHPIFEGGIGVLLREDDTGGSFLSALFTRDILFVVLGALGLLFGSGVVMWLLERRAQPYFDRKGGDALFHSFWWSLNLVVNGGFEERVPQTRPGRAFAVVLVVSSLFIVSIFVATITSTMTIDALHDNVESINDLEGRRVATIEGSTSADFLNARDLPYVGYGSPEEMFKQLESDNLDAIVFDAPILSYYSNTHSEPATRLLPRIYRRENYGIALSNSDPISEQINRSLLRLREAGTYDELVTKWFGRSDG
ncbi:transporter substrate-binding domain-containing protein [Octadecabacter sp. 1_MG-2023]|uniref:transporter substrate-binding domain-containing protein n=1 Tax=unclassified Octadecabacter TaxID=196158 RepID=UPI001C09B260|nr:MULTISPECIES: transporter substrate-binding domain-containing protein [unclassified Octadecabacter]MBU2992456.1 transporter substrate-binding domain-containing protein [Octadecabacter sp. B2R22]MDO6734788.1 transporter substrate-binding domain-containing protein [Octadecabacter sp. 1_MG-2023]